jgi:diguanylate cyclase (GGDEF)-like protein
LSLGLDNFKAINDSFGPHRADELLITIAKRLKSGLKSGDHLARVGGDEFAILLPQIQDIDEVAHLADYLQKQIKQPFVLQGQEVFTSTSVGIVLNELDRYLQPEDVLRDAQTAMNQAKASGKARYQVFMPGMRVQVMTRLQLETDLRRAIERQEFQLHYQPVVSLLTGKISGFEALLRWQNPQRGFVHPMEFISVAEETDLIIPIGQWVIEEACHQVQIWQHRFPQLAPLVVSVNLSSKQFAQANLVEQIEQTLRQTGLNGHNLKLEITESIAMTDVETTIAMLMRLKALDLQLSIDDFGTGYSSLSYLHRFPTDTIKVDRSFVSRMGSENENSHIVQTVIMLGHNLGMDIVAEGVETTGQLAQLRALKCEYGQGYFFSKPLPSEAIEQLLKTDPQW